MFFLWLFRRFSLFAKNLRGGADNRPPAVRGLKVDCLTSQYKVSVRTYKCPLSPGAMFHPAYYHIMRTFEYWFGPHGGPGRCSWLCRPSRRPSTVCGWRSRRGRLMYAVEATAQYPAASSMPLSRSARRDATAPPPTSCLSCLSSHLPTMPSSHPAPPHPHTSRSFRTRSRCFHPQITQICQRRPAKRSDVVWNGSADTASI